MRTKADFDRLDSLIIESDIVDWIRLTPKRHKDPLGVMPGNSRFCAKLDKHAVLYAARLYETAFAEVVIRNRFDNGKARLINQSELEVINAVAIRSRETLRILDLAGNNPISVGIPNAVLRHSDHRSGRAFARNCYKFKPDVDAILYPSRFNTALCIGVFDRAIRKLKATAKIPLHRHPETTRLLNLFNLKIRP